MGLDCGATLAKYLLCLFNFIFFVVGTCVLCIGIWLAIDKASFIKLTRYNVLNEGVELNDEVKNLIGELTEPSVIEQAAYILIAAGAFIFIVSFLGYCGAVKESRVLLVTYGLVLVLIFILQVVLIVLTSIYRAEAEGHTKEFFQHTIRKYYTSHSRRDAVTLTWDVLMAELHCCGVNNYKDFDAATAFHNAISEKGNEQVIPEACCILQTNQSFNFLPVDANCITAPSTSNSYMNDGCFAKVYEWIVKNLNIIIISAVSIIAIEILGIIFAFCLNKSLTNERDYPYKY